MMKFRVLTPLVLAMGMVLSGCATQLPAVSTLTDEQPNQDGKTFLMNATSSRLKSSFDYRTDVFVGQPQLVVQDATEADCESIHDKRYVALKKRIKQNNALDSDEPYKGEFKDIKREFLACQKATEQAQNGYQEFDFGAYQQEAKAQSLDAKLRGELFGQYTQAHLAQQYSEPKENDTDPLAVKKAQLLDAYLLKPTSVSVVGRYEPLAGKFTALPSVSYHQKNLSIAVNQPIYVDLKAGGVYLWADNFALANSQMLDKNLGTSWYNKWLFLPINDGTLPPSFAKDLLQAYVLAKKESHLAMPDGAFVWTNAQKMSELPNIEQNLSTKADIIKNTSYILQSRPTAKDKAYSEYVFNDVFYQTLTKKYPELTLESRFGDGQFAERTITEGQSVIHVGNRDDVSPKNTSDVINMDAKTVMTMMLAQMRGRVSDYYETLGETQTDNEQYLPISHYGFVGGKLSWIHQRHYLTNQMSKSLTKNITDEPMFVDVFTQITPKSSESDFARLPSHAQTPNAQNSVNVFEYKEQFLQSLKNSDDRYLQMLVALLTGSQEQSAEDMPADIEIESEPK